MKQRSDRSVRKYVVSSARVVYARAWGSTNSYTAVRNTDGYHIMCVRVGWCMCEREREHVCIHCQLCSMQCTELSLSRAFAEAQQHLVCLFVGCCMDRQWHAVWVPLSLVAHLG